MRRLNPPPRADLVSQPYANDWLQAVTERLGVYRGAADPTAAELPTNQWVLFKNTTTNTVSFFYNDDGVLRNVVVGAGSSGDVIGPAASVNNNVAMFSGITGKLLKDSGLTLSGSNTGDQTITLTSDVTGTGTGSFATTIAPNAVTYAKMQDVSAASRLLGRGSAAGAGDPQELALGPGLTMTGTTLDTTPGAGTGDVVGPAGAVNNNVVFFNGVTGKLIKDSGLTLSGSNTGDQTITLTSDVTGAGSGSFATTIAPGVVTLAKMANLPTVTLIGNNTGGSATPLALTATQVKGFLTYTAADVGLGSVTNDVQTKAAIVPNTAPSAGQVLVGNAGGTAYAPVTSSGDVTVSSAGAFTIGTGVVTYAKIQNIAATARVLGRRSAGAGPIEEMTASQVLDLVGNTQGLIAFRGAAAWSALAVGTAGKVLSTNGAGADPSWVSQKEQLANVTLGIAGTSLASGTFAARRFLEIHVFIPGYAGSDTASFQFNAAAGTAYRYQWATMAAAATTFTAGLTAASTDRIKIASTNTTNSRRVVAHISNDATITEKLVTFESKFGTGSSATQATRDIGDGAWVSGATTQITAVSLLSTSNMNAGTQMVIYGWN